MKLMVYSHDAFGLGNIRRMLAICDYLLRAIPDLSVLVVSGSPALHSLRLPKGLDYIKLPCLGRDGSGQVSAKFLKTDLEETVQLRSDLILSATKHFKPDVLLVDKKPYGLMRELEKTLDFLEQSPISTQLVLLLRDILDEPAVTIAQWQRNGYYEAIAQRYAQVWVVGDADIFDVRSEYDFPPSVAEKVEFCGYIRRSPGLQSRDAVRHQLCVEAHDRLVLVTPGGGADGYQLVDTYLEAIQAKFSSPNAQSLVEDPTFKSLIVCGYEMPIEQRQAIAEKALPFTQVEVIEFSDDVLSLMDAADLVISMGGYNTICEILSLNKRAIVVPRVNPVEEQWIRAERFAQRGWFHTIHPEQLTPRRLTFTIERAIAPSSNVDSKSRDAPTHSSLDLNALPRMTQLMASLMPGMTPIHSSVVYSQPPSPCLIPPSLQLAISLKPSLNSLKPSF
ncbi:MAG: glycosyltransferase [Leptolyngbyaceae bacterium]|nr:glycosyltransferase [Leptolyngbyaceae bacterium]